VGRHDWRLHTSARHRIAKATTMLGNEPRPALAIGARPPRRRFHKHLNPAGGGDAEQSDSEQSAQLQHPTIALAPPPPCQPNREPYLIASRHPVDALQDELEIECELELTHDDEWRLTIPQSDEIAATDLAFDLEAKTLEVALDRRIEESLADPR